MPNLEKVQEMESCNSAFLTVKTGSDKNKNHE